MHKSPVTSIEEGRHSLILELRINLRIVCLGKKKSLYVPRAALTQNVLAVCQCLVIGLQSLSSDQELLSSSITHHRPFILSTMKSGCGAVWFTLGLVDYCQSWEQVSFLITLRVTNSYTLGFTIS